MEELKNYVDEWLEYNPDSGKFFWKKDGKTGTRKKGRETANINSDGYKLIKLKGKLYKSHRIAYLIMTGEMPEYVDHIDRNRSNNRWKNLRKVSSSENSFNRSLDKRNKTGITGVYLHPTEQTYIVTVGKRVVGRTKSLFEAACLRKSKENERL